MEAKERSTLEERLAELFSDRKDDAITKVESDVLLRIEKARDAWLKERLSEQDFEEWRRRCYFGPAGEEFPRGWVEMEIQVETAMTEAAYRQGLQDGAQLMAMLLGLIPLP